MASSYNRLAKPLRTWEGMNYQERAPPNRPPRNDQLLRTGTRCSFILLGTGAEQQTRGGSYEPSLFLEVEEDQAIYYGDREGGS